MRNLLLGSNIKLTAVKESDVAIIEEWFNNVEFLRNYDMLPAIPQNAKSIKELFEYFQGSNERYIFSIRIRESNQMVGIAGFDDIMWSNGVATFFIGIGEEECRGKGYGKEAMKLLIDFGFNELNFHRVQLNVISYNERAVKLYESMGFIKEGVHRELIYRDGKRHDLYLYGLLKNEWNRL